MSGEEWSEWFIHTGDHIPDRVIGQFIHIITNDGDEVEILERPGEAEFSKFGKLFVVAGGVNAAWGWIWDHPDTNIEEDPIIYYRIKRPRGAALFNEILRTVEETEPQEIDA